MATKKCPVCGVPVKVENLERHLKNQHPRDRVDTTELLTVEEQRAVEKSKAAMKPTLTSAGKRTIVIVAIALVAILVLAVVVTTWRPPGPNVGQTAPNFTLSTSTGGSVTLTQYRGQPVFLEFMNTLCPACNNEAPTLAYVYRSFGTRVHFLSVDMAIPGDLPLNTAAEIEAFKTKYATPWVYSIDSDGTVANSYGVQGTPTMFVINANGIVSATPAYPASYSGIANALNQTLG